MPPKKSRYSYHQYTTKYQYIKKTIYKKINIFFYKIPYFRPQSPSYPPNHESDSNNIIFISPIVTSTFPILYHLYASSILTRHTLKLFHLLFTLNLYISILIFLNCPMLCLLCLCLCLIYHGFFLHAVVVRGSCFVLIVCLFFLTFCLLFIRTFCIVLILLTILFSILLFHLLLFLLFLSNH